MFFTSDTHFDHENIIKYCNRPFTNKMEMNEAIIDKWNDKIGLNDEVWHLGDVTFGDPVYVLPRLNGRINLIVGNHDHKKLSDIAKNITGRIYDLHEVKVGKNHFVLCHYPMARWNKMHYGYMHLHGHTHGEYKDDFKFIMDVGIDTHPNYEPYHIDEIMVYMTKVAMRRER